MKAQTIIDTARRYVGYNEADASHRFFVDTYNEYCREHGYPRGYKVQYSDSWCDVFVSCLFILNNCVDLIGGVECGVEEHVAIFKRLGIWKDGRSVIPSPGDLIVYDWHGDGVADHIGLVETVDGNNITTIEGNYQDSVKRRYLTVGTTSIKGYACPKYQGEVIQDCYFVKKNGKTLNSFHILENANLLATLPSGKLTCDAREAGVLGGRCRLVTGVGSNADVVQGRKIQMRDFRHELRAVVQRAALQGRFIFPVSMADLQLKACAGA